MLSPSITSKSTFSWKILEHTVYYQRPESRIWDSIKTKSSLKEKAKQLIKEKSQ